MDMSTSRRGCFCFSARALMVLAWMKLVLDISFISYHFYNISGLLDLYKINVQGTDNCEDCVTNQTTEGDSITEEIILSSCQLPIFWITVTPVLKLLMDIAFDISIIFGCIKKNVDLLIISYGYSVLMAVFYLVGFYCVLILHLDHKNQFGNIIKEYFMAAMPLVAIVNDLDIGDAKIVLGWLLWISFVVFMSFYLPYLLKAEVKRMDTKDELATYDPVPEDDQTRLLYILFKLGLFKMLIVKVVVVGILVIYTAYFVTAMYKLHVVEGHIIMVLAIITPLLMLDMAFNVLLFIGQNMQNTTLLKMYCTYNDYIRLVNVVIAMGLKYHEFAFCLLQAKDYWAILLYNFHMYLVLWIVYVVVHFYVELVTEMEIAKFSNGIPLAPVSTVLELSTDSNSQYRKRISQ